MSWRLRAGGWWRPFSDQPARLLWAGLLLPDSLTLSQAHTAGRTGAVGPGQARSSGTGQGTRDGHSDVPEEQEDSGHRVCMGATHWRMGQEDPRRQASELTRPDPRPDTAVGAGPASKTRCGPVEGDRERASHRAGVGTGQPGAAEAAVRLAWLCEGLGDWRS